ncbi:MAG TPA: cytochrome P460 family protein, partial [Bryobacteraceae bacterium]|nr:cytochrome P460 family protein [Bryobacteraceae bacterium]
MTTLTKTMLLAATVLVSAALFTQNYPPPKQGWDAKEQMNLPPNYREWVYLTTGFDMSYNPELAAMDHSMFDNVFVNPEAYKKFVETGTWPDKTVMVLEARMAENKGSINQ